MKFDQIILGMNMVVGGINVAMFFFLINQIDVSIKDPGLSEKVLANISFQMSMMQTTFTIVGLLIAVAAFMGYQALRDAAIDAAQKAAREVIATWGPMTSATNLMPETPTQTNGSNDQNRKELG